MMAGWIKIYRELADHWLASQPEKLGWWVLLLLKAEREDRKVFVGNQIVELKRGQIIASNSFLADLWRTSERTVGRFLDVLEEEKMLHRCTHRKITVLTICNYESYQESKRVRRTDVCTDDAGILPESCRQYKEDRERKKETISKDIVKKERFQKPTIQEVADYCKERGNGIDAEAFINFYESKGWMVGKSPMKSWKAAIGTWEKRRDHGNDNTPNQRRGVQIVANEVKDYYGSF